jgi:cytidine deaminase
MSAEALRRAALADARALIARLKEEGRHHVAATVLTANGAYTAANLECMLPRGAICAEAVAIGMAAVAEPRAPILFSVAVNRRGEVIPPCGFCRELLMDYGPRAMVCVAEEPDGGLRLRSLAALLPDAYKAHLRPGPGPDGAAGGG